MLSKTSILICLVITPILLHAQIKDKCSIFYTDSLQKLRLSIVPNANLGTHINGAGADMLLDYKFWDKRKSSMTIGSRSGAKYYLTYLGIPGSSFTLEQQFEFSYSFGKNYFIPAYLSANQRRHTLSYYFLGYYSTDQTSQLSGGLKYRFIAPALEINCIIEDDFLACRSLDEFRTFAFELNAKKVNKKNMPGIGAGLILWTGTTKGLGFLHRGEVYDLTNKPGGAYSNGIAYIKFYYGNFGLSIGYDSEEIRAGLQNPFHDWIDDGRIPPLKRGDKVFIQLSLWDFGSLY